MGFFNKILKGLGFEDEEEPVKSEKKPRQKKVRKTSVTASYNLDNYSVKENKVQKEQIKEETTNENSSPLEFELIKVYSQIDVQNVVNKIKANQKVLLNIENLTNADVTRSLDFILGAVFALDLTMQKVDEKLYLISNKRS